MRFRSTKASKNDLHHLKRSIIRMDSGFKAFLCACAGVSYHGIHFWKLKVGNSSIIQRSCHVFHEINYPVVVLQSVETSI
jgi:hypothetical protein